MTRRTTQKDFKEFKKHCEYWHKMFGLGGYELEVNFKASKKNNSETYVMHEAARIVIALGEKIDKEDLKELALHEVLHGLLASLAAYANGAKSEHVVAEEEHKIINHIINCIKNNN